MRTRITVVGLGYVGMASAVLLAQRHDVVALEINEERAALVNAGRSPIEGVMVAMRDRPRSGHSSPDETMR